MDTQDTPESWEQRDGEPDRDHARFLQWLALPDRRLTAACEPLGLKRARLSQLMHTWEWQQRAADYDRRQAHEYLSGSHRQRLSAGIALATVVRQAAEDMLQGVERHDPLAVQRLASALRTITPGTTLEDLMPTAAPELDAGDIVQRALQLAREHERERDEREELYGRTERPAITPAAPQLAPEPADPEPSEPEHGNPQDVGTKPQQSARLGVSVRALLRGDR